MMNLTIPMPARVAALPRHPQTGAPVPAWAPTTPDGPPADPTAESEVAYLRAILDRTCYLCGETLGYWLAFIGSAAMMEAQIFGRPPFHRDCGRWALESGLLVSTQRLGLYVTRSFESFRADPASTTVYLRAAPAKEIEWPEPQLLVRPGSGLDRTTGGLVLP